MPIYYLGLAFLVAHELDAVTHSEWRLLFGLRTLPDPPASSLFVSLHVPLFFAILWLSHHQRKWLRDGTRVVVAVFLVVHAVLHIGLSSAPQYTFHGVLSNTLILGAGASGIAYLGFRWSSRSSR